MKAQMKFQKILTLVSLIISVLPILYALIFFSGNLSDLLTYRSSYLAGGLWDGWNYADKFIDLGQSFVSTMVVLGIVFILSVILLYITATNTRRNYYITNYIAIGIYVAVGLVVVVYGIISVTMALSAFVNLDWAELELLIEDARSFNYSASQYPDVTQAKTMFIIGYVLFVVVLANLAVYVLNLVWKIKLMQGERKLLAAGLAKEVA